MNFARKHFFHHVMPLAAAVALTVVSCSDDSPSAPKAPVTVNKVLQLDGVDSYVDVPIANHQFNRFTVEVWVKVAAYGPNVHFVSLYQNAFLAVGNFGSGPISTWAEGLNPVNAGDAAAEPVISTDAWHHFAFSYDGTKQEIVFDGDLVLTIPTTGAVTHNPTTYTSTMSIGARFDGASQFVAGQIDDVRLWNVYRTPAQIKANRNKVIADQSGLVGNWTFDDGTARDRSAYQADGTLMGGATIVNK